MIPLAHADRHPAVRERLATLAASDPAYARLLVHIESGAVGARVSPRDGRPRAFLVTPSVNIGGADRWMIALMAATSSRIDWTAVVCTGDYQVVPEMRVEVERFAPVVMGWGRVAAAAAVADLCVAWGVNMATLAGNLGHEPPPVVGVSHGVGSWTRDLFADPGRATLVAVSRAALATFPESARAGAKVIENGVEPDRLVPRFELSMWREVRDSWGICMGEKTLVQVGRLSPEKNPMAIADAVAALHRMGHTEWRGVHVGTGWIQADVKAHARLVAPGLIRFPGTTSDVASAYLAADALALPSHEEACSLMMIEAMWVGSPLIVSTVGIAEESEIAALCRTVRPGCSGAELAAAVLADQSDPDGTAGRAAMAKEVARDRFRPERFASEWSALLEATWRRPQARQISVPASRAPDESGWSPACGHRSTRWCCNQELRILCGIGRGAGGIIEEDDCVGCEAREESP